MAVVELNIEEFLEAYPQFTGMSEAQIMLDFETASELACNKDCSRIPYAPPVTMTRQLIIWMIMCHLLELSRRGNGVVGSLTSATEGSVSSGFAVPASSSSSAWWWNQTQCGAAAWQLLSKFALGGKLYNGCFR